MISEEKSKIIYTPGAYFTPALISESLKLLGSSVHTKDVASKFSKKGNRWYGKVGITLNDAVFDPHKRSANRRSEP
jgi:hypothetical protein